jgi:Kef-type K+ transport system membrane component KefB
MTRASTRLYEPRTITPFRVNQRPSLMNSIEMVIILLLLCMGVPDLCRRFNRSALSYPGFILIGLVLEPLVDTSVATMVKQAGHVGFLLLLFEVGLEIDLPRLRQFLPALQFALLWSVLLLPLALALALYAGLDVPQACLAATALTGCSVSIVHPAWKALPVRSQAVKVHILHILVALEMLSIVAMAVCGTALHSGVNGWILVRLAGIGLVVMLLARFSAHLTTLFQTVISRTTHWRLHWLTLTILAACALGNRLGLDAAKTAFFLGLALSRAKHNGVNLQAHMAPISRQLMIPLFFVALGLQIPLGALNGRSALLVIGAAGLLLGVREIIHRRWLPSGGAETCFLLFCPNLTMAALAASTLLKYDGTSEAAAWVLGTGLIMTVPAIVLLPYGDSTPPRGAWGTVTQKHLTADPTKASPVVASLSQRPHNLPNNHEPVCNC